MHREAKKDCSELHSLEEAETQKPLVNEEIDPEHLYLKHKANARLDRFVPLLP